MNALSEHLMKSMRQAVIRLQAVIRTQAVILRDRRIRF
jgi:hypothetical protein